MIQAREIIILAGGQGSRLRSVIGDKPKCLAPIAGQPFLHFLIRHFQHQGIQRFTFSLGKGHAMVTEFLSSQYPVLDYQVQIERDPLGTGGAIRSALQEVSTGQVWIANGDSLLYTNMEALEDLHHSRNSTCTLALTQVQKGDRYGSVDTDEHGRILQFAEKKQQESAWINGGLYLVNRSLIQESLPLGTFSWEKDVLAAQAAKDRFFGYPCEGYFIDIGTEQDYYRAQNELPTYVA